MLKRGVFIVVVLTVLVLSSAFVSAARLPTVSGDSGTWGTVLNQFLNVSLTENGTIRNNTINTEQLNSSVVTGEKVATRVINETHLAYDSINRSHIINETITDDDIWNSTNLTLGQKLTFSNGVIVDNIATNLFTVTGKTNITNNLSLGGDLTFEKNITLNSGTYQIGYRAPNSGTPSLFFGVPGGSAFAWFFSTTIQPLILATSGSDIFFNLTNPTAGADVQFNVMQTDDTNANSDAGITIRTGGSSAGDPYMLLGVGTGNSAAFILGIDNSDSDRLVLASGGSLDSSRIFDVRTGGGPSIVTFSANNLSLTNTSNSGTLRLSGSGSLFGYGAATSATISAGQLSVARSYHGVLNGTGSNANVIANMNGSLPGLQDGDIVILKPADATINVTLSHNHQGAGNLRLAGQANFTLDGVNDRVVLQYDGTNWVEISRSNGNS